MNAFTHFTICRALLPAVCFAFTCHGTIEAREKSNAFYGSTSRLLSVAVNDPIPVISYGISPHFCSGGNLVLTCSAASSYQWFKDGVALSETNLQTLTVYESGAYTVVVNYGNGPVASQEVVITQANSWTGAANDGNWLNAANWSCGVLPLAADLTIIENSGSDPVISGQELMEVNKLQIDGTASLRVESGSTLWVTDAVHVASTASLILKNNASLVQVNEASNTGKITVERSTTPMKKYDYTYWSSPVSGQTLYDLSPGTLPDKYYSFSPSIGNWVSHLYGATVMDAALGYIVRAPQSFSPTTAAVYDASFTGTPNNGTVYTAVNVGISDMNLIGNPYPSAIDMDAFLTDPGNAALVEGTIYLWAHNAAPAVIPGDNTYNYSSNDYAAYNLLGGLATSAAGNSARPEGKVASGQSFFMKALADGSLVFRNDMRLAFVNSNFYRNNQTTVEKHRLWVSISNEQGAYKQTLLGYVDGATNGIDHNYDGRTFNGHTFLDFYSLEANTKLSIQGRALPFDDSQIIPLGYSTTFASSFVINLDDFDGLFENQPVYVYDNETMTLHNLRDGGYAFSTGIGTFNNRFELRFVGEALAINGFSSDSTAVSVKNKTIAIQSSELLDEVSIYDLSGRCIYQAAAVNTNKLSISDLYQNGVFIIKIKLGKGNTIAKKIMI